MNFEDHRKQNAKAIEQYELDDDALERLIEDKFKRARAYQLAFSKREDELVECD